MAADRFSPKKLAGWAIGLVFLFFLVTQIAMSLLGAKLPEGATPGPAADALAKEIEAAIHAESWSATGAVSFTFRGKNHHLWDRRRQRAKVRFGETTVLLDLTKRRGIVEHKGQRLVGEPEKAALAQAERVFWNDTFWLNPLVKLFDEGVVRGLTSPVDEPPGTRGLLVTYTTGGVTPGDSYLWLVGPEGRPIAWRMWTSVFPIQGIRVTWDQWTALPSGAVVSTTHRLPGVSIEISDLQAASSIEELVKGPDPLAALDAI